MASRKPPTPESHVLAAFFVLLTLSILTTAARIWGRRAMGAFGADDVLIVFGAAAAVAMVAVEVIKMRGIYRCADSMEHNDYHLDFVSLAPTLNSLWRMAWVADFIYFALLAFVKCSILCFYKRIGPPHYYWVLYLLMSLLVLNSVIHTILNLVAVTPVQAQWDLFIKEIPFTKHVALEVIDLSFSSVQGAFDVVILALPVPVLWSLKLRTAKKATLVVVYLIGFISFVATLVRIQQAAYFLRLKDTYESFSDNPGYTTWTQGEIHAAIICANIPAIFAAGKLLPWQRLRTKLSSSRLTGSTDKTPRTSGQTSEQSSKGKSSGSRTLSHSRSGESDAYILRETDIYVTKEGKESYEMTPV